MRFLEGASRNNNSRVYVLMNTLPLAALLLSLVSAAPRSGSSGPRYERRWVYVMTNLQVKEQADKVIDLIGRSARAGYNGVVLADYKLSILDRVPDHYFANIKRVQAAAASARVELIPSLFPIGYSNGLLAHDPNLAEGLPVVDAPFVARGREAVPDAKSIASLANGDFEETNGDKFLRFGFQDGPGTATLADHKVVHHGKTSCRMEAAGTSEGNRRVMQRVAVRPHTAYRISAWVKTDELSIAGSFRLLALGTRESGKTLTFFEGGVESNQDWKQVEVVFNSLDNDAVNVYAGLWGAGKGRLWIDEFSLDELGLVNVLRRPGCPFTVTSSDGKTVYEEGKDFEPVADAKLGNVPYAGEYEFGHEPARIRLTSRSRVREGQSLKVSWYHPIITHGSQVMCCPSEPKTYELLRDQAKRVNALLRPKTFFMSHDEIRVMNWCKACTSRKMTPGQILADNVKRCTAILKDVSPRATAVIWSDMFDPKHNAVKEYYLVNGTLEGSWLGVAPEVAIANWNGGKMRESLEFFSSRGHQQIIAGYYDADDLSGFAGWDEAARGVKGVNGYMYTTWQSKYGLLDSYGKAIRESR